MAPYIAYISMGEIIPSLLMLVFYVFSIVATYCVTRTSEREGFFNVPRLIQLALKSMFLELTIEESELGTTRYMVRKKQLRTWSVRGLALVTLNVFGCSTATLWTVLFIRESVTCGEKGFDCFYNRERVMDCSVFENGAIVSTNGTVHILECYRFVFDYVKGFTAAGGITFFAKIVINTLVFTFASIGEVHNSYCRVFWMVLVSLLLGVSVAGFHALNVVLRVFDDLLISGLLLPVIYTITLIISAFTCIPLAVDMSTTRKGYENVSSQ